MSRRRIRPKNGASHSAGWKFSALAAAFPELIVWGASGQFRKTLQSLRTDGRGKQKCKAKTISATHVTGEIMMNLTREQIQANTITFSKRRKDAKREEASTQTFEKELLPYSALRMRLPLENMNTKRRLMPGITDTSTTIGQRKVCTA